MRAPVAVTLNVPLGPERRWQLLLSAAFVLLLIAQLLWFIGQFDAGLSTPLMLVAAGLCTLANLALGRAFWRLGRPAARVLRWTGLTWQLLATGSAPCSGRVDVAIDLGNWLLLRHRAADGPDRWLPVAAARRPRRWHALRCALAASRHVDAGGRRDDAA